MGDPFTLQEGRCKNIGRSERLQNPVVIPQGHSRQPCHAHAVRRLRNTHTGWAPSKNVEGVTDSVELEDWREISRKFFQANPFPSPEFEFGAANRSPKEKKTKRKKKIHTMEDCAPTLRGLVEIFICF